MSFRVASVSTSFARNLSRSGIKNTALKNHLVGVELNRSKLGFLSCSRRFVDTNSWANDRLQELGVKVEAGPELPLVEVNEKSFENPSPKVVAVLNQVLSMNVLEMSQFVRSLQKILGYSDAMMSGGGGVVSGGGGGGAPAAAAEAPKVKELFDVKLAAVDAAAKIKVIKEVRALTGLGLKEAKELVEKAPVVIRPAIKKDEADAIVKQLTDAGAKVELV